MALTARRIIVCTAALATVANAASKKVDTIGGERAFTVGLRAAGDATNTIVAYWCSWLFDPAVLATLKTYATAGGFTNAEATERPVGFTATVAALPRLAFFDDAIWTPAAVLTALGLDVLVLPLGTL